ncbi:MAG: hypothetical protein AB1938_24010 [Myxococcota bacterium]
MTPKLLFARWVLAAGLVLGLALRLVIVFGGDEGIIWPDEVYQSLEPAHRLVFGYGFVAWEFIEGARNWALPGFVAFWMKLSALFGGDSPFVYLRVVRLVFALLSVGAAWGVYRLAVVLGAKEVPAAAAAALWACCAVALLFAHRAMSENAAAATVVWGLALVLERTATRRRLLLGASLLGVATLMRLQAGLFCAGALGILAARAVADSRWWRRLRPTAAARLGRFGAWLFPTLPAAEEKPAPLTPWRRVGEVLLVLLLWAVVYGALDAATWKDAPGAKWGGWFHSAVVYLRFNLIEGRAAGWGTSPWSYYIRHLWEPMPVVTALLAVGGVLALRRAPGAVLLVLAFTGLHMAVGHKELRFILPVLPVACALVGLALSWRPFSPPTAGQAPTAPPDASSARPSAREDAPLTRFQRLLVAFVLAAAAWSGLRADKLTMGEVGSYASRAKSSAWDDFGNVNRLLLAASRQKDLCGLRIDVTHMAWAGGYSYLHRNVPVFGQGMPHQQGFFNYVITFPGSGAEVVAQDKGIELVRLPGMTTCTPYPDFSWRLP